MTKGAELLSEVCIFSVQCRLNTVHYNVHFRLDTVDWTLYNVHRRMYTVDWILKTGHCRLFTVDCRL